MRVFKEEGGGELKQLDQNNSISVYQVDLAVVYDLSRESLLGGRRTTRGTPGREPHNPYQIPNIPYQIWNCISF